MGYFKVLIASLCVAVSLDAAPIVHPRQGGPKARPEVPAGSSAGLEGPPRGQELGPAPEDPREPERQRLRQEIHDLRQRLQRAGEAAVGRDGQAWWDLPRRRRQELRLRQLRALRERLEDAQARLLELEGPPPRRPEKALEDKPRPTPAAP